MGFAYGLTIFCLLAVAQANINPDDVTYKFYSRANFNGVLIRNASQVNSNVFNPSLPTIVSVHGWRDSYEADSNTFVRVAVLSKINANLIKVDWSPLSGLGYLASRNAVPEVGREAAKLLSAITSRFSYSLNNVYLVGFSLGAHVVGNIGKALNGGVSLIIALDPAGPLISSSDASYCVQPEDAQYVQAIHTNAGTLGMTDPVGHSDFYPNGGSRQGGCGIDLFGTCAHNRAWELFAESLGDNRFVARQCGSWDNYNRGSCSSNDRRLMGGFLNVDRSARGSYYLATNNASPYGRN